MSTLIAPSPLAEIQTLRQQTLKQDLGVDEFTVFDALHQLRLVENYRGHMFCSDPLTGAYWERLVQGDHLVPPPMTAAMWRTSVDTWIKHHPSLRRFGVVDDQDLVYRFWKQVLDQVLVSRPTVTKLRRVEREIWPAVTSPRPEDLRGYMLAIARRLERGGEFVPSEELLIEILEEMDLIVRDVVFYADLTTDEKQVYPGPFVRCQRRSASLLNRIADTRSKSKGQKLLTTRSAAEFVVAAARQLGLTVPDASIAFYHLYPSGSRS
ncbi:hypothetical protein LEM8419_03474 [Neolewinella maritima]|uniref:Uncharacterized protein n=1 Tax=Neolewinella maritima TaxID=1383882 RepID=A0ABM9B5D5_9BACT|nr:hypothetical protein [Neolewinella maritima]CAH1002602.1 hypothetical protein LEM8419_03474 [Neolewinella maritima]